MRNALAKEEPLRWNRFPSPVGELLLVADEGDRLVRIGFPQGSGRVEPDSRWRHDCEAAALARQQLREYFAGERQTFELELRPLGTEFQIEVWTALGTIPFGQTISYGELARRIGRPAGASRAVGAANGANPLPIVLPCHRVIGADGSLTGFGGGLDTKQFLLEHEGAFPGHDGGRQLELL